MRHNSSIFRLLNEPQGLRYQGGAVAYAVLAYSAGLAGLFHGNPAVNIAATLLLAHGIPRHQLADSEFRFSQCESTPTGRDYLAAAQRADVHGGNAASFLTSF